MSACARGFASISDKSTRINAAFYAYWMLPDVSATDLALGATGRPHPAKLLKLGGSVVGDFKCDRCGDGLEVRSRNHMGDLMRGQPWAEGYRLLCPWCAQEVSEERSRAHDAERKAQDARTAELQALPYQTYLQTEDWLHQRSSFIWFCLNEHGGLQCEVCNREGELGIYHQSFERLGESDALTLLCDACVAPLYSAGRLAGTICPENALSDEEAKRSRRAYLEDLGVPPSELATG